MSIRVRLSRSCTMISNWWTAFAVSIGMASTRALVEIEIANSEIISHLDERELFYINFGFEKMPKPGAGKLVVMIALVRIGKIQ